ncbi:(2Fe-2S) ferredoxin domain-containing protein [Clostridium sp. DL1XJH146]
MDIHICIGSSCHLKGSYEVITKLTELVEKNNLREKVIIKAAFCLGKCTQSVSVRINENEFYSVNKDKVDEFFNDYVSSRL